VTHARARAPKRGHPRSAARAQSPRGRATPGAHRRQARTRTPPRPAVIDSCSSIIRRSCSRPSPFRAETATSCGPVAAASNHGAPAGRSCSEHEGVAWSPLPRFPAALHGGILLLVFGMRSVRDLKQQRGFLQFLERGAEGGHQVGGQFADEAHGVGEQRGWRDQE